jgi:hypothetical protein
MGNVPKGYRYRGLRRSIGTTGRSLLSQHPSVLGAAVADPTLGD